MRLIFWCVLSLVAISCTDKVNPLPQPELSYMNLTAGNTWTYSVEENEYTPGNVVSSLYYLKDSLVDAGNGYSVYRFRTVDLDQDWDLELVWNIEVSEQRVLFTIDDKISINWVFPPKEGKTWIGTAFSQDPVQEFRMEEVGISFLSKENIDFDQTTRVTQWNNEDFIVELEYRTEVFQKDIGLVESEEKNYIYCQEPSCLGDQQVDVGFDKVISLVEWNLN